MNSGIYCIENTINQKRYVGASKNIKSRLYTHKQQLKGNRHDNPHLQASFNKHGEKNFKFYTLEYTKTEDLATRELWWIEDMKTLDRSCGYNISKVPYGITPDTKTMSHKEAIGKACKITTDAYYDRIKKEGKLEIRVYDLITGEYETFSASVDCPYTFKNKCKNFRTAKCKISTYNKTEEEIQEEFEAVRLKYKKYLKSQSTGTGYNDRKRKVYKYEFLLWEDGILHTYNNLQDIANHINVYPETVYTLSHKDYFVFNKYTVFKDNITDSAYKKVILEKKYSLTKGLMERVLRGEAKTHRGFSIKKEPITLKIIINKELVYKTDL